MCVSAWMHTWEHVLRACMFVSVREYVRTRSWGAFVRMRICADVCVPACACTRMCVDACCSSYHVVLYFIANINHSLINNRK